MTVLLLTKPVIQNHSIQLGVFSGWLFSEPFDQTKWFQPYRTISSLTLASISLSLLPSTCQGHFPIPTAVFHSFLCCLLVLIRWLHCSSLLTARVILVNAYKQSHWDKARHVLLVFQYLYNNRMQFGQLSDSQAFAFDIHYVLPKNFAQFSPTALSQNCCILMPSFVT
jgi:hypothetical protein